MTPIIVWFRQDLRLLDNPALFHAAQSGAPVIPLYIFDEHDPWAPGSASRWWLHKSIEALQKDVPLILRRGNPETILKEIIEKSGAQAVYWNRLYEPYLKGRDEKIKAKLKSQGLQAQSFNSALLIEPWEHLKSDGTPYQVFTPFWKGFLAKGHPPKPLEKPQNLKFYEGHIHSEDLNSWGFLPQRPNWAQGFEEMWAPGEEGALQRLEEFLEENVKSYPDERNRPDCAGTSRLSAHLHWGEISPRTVWYQTQTRIHEKGWDREGLDYLRELAWREFSYHLLFHNPDLPSKPLRREFENFPWEFNEEHFTRWQKGLTGYPIVDAGMRELWHTGWMHNRVRMVVASFLIKDLLIHWSKGEAWFWDTLVDADLSNNAASWQWVAGSGADASPYFRIFNPVLQGEKFDPNGDYVRKWIPELNGLPSAWIHKPYDAPLDILKDAGIVLGTTYPKPIVDHKKARDKALGAYKALR